MTPIKIEGLTKIFRHRRRQVVALDRLDLRIESGEIFGFLGPNGAGKSTTIKSLLGLIRPTAGSVRMFGAPANEPAARRRIGFLPENPAFYDFLNAREFLALVGRTFGMNEAVMKKETDCVLELLNLRHAERRPIRSYSKGMVQRLGLAQAMLHEPDLYILDEPMSGLDPLGRALVKQIMLDLKERGKTVFFSTHVTADVEAVCDRVGVIVSGRLQSINDVNDLLEKGILGYDVHLTNCPESVFVGFNASEHAGGVREVFVPRDELNRFMAKVAGEGGNIQLMEPRRRNLEQFFLDIVKRESG